MKVQPRARTGVIVLLVYLTAFYGVWIVTGIDYQDIGDSAATLLRWYVAPLAAGAVVLVVAATWLGWWRPALRETQRAPWWTLVTPVLMLVVGILMLAGKDFSDTTGRMWLYLALGSLGVGFCEELATRGLLLVGLRGSMPESRVWFWSSLLFGLLHLPNWAFGSGPAAMFQVVLAFLMGSTLYLLRRGSGFLLPAMLLHGFWDFATFAGDGHPAIGLLGTPIGLVSVILVIVLHRRQRDVALAPYAEPRAVAAT